MSENIRIVIKPRDDAKRITKAELMSEYEKFKHCKEYNTENAYIGLYIHMPDDSNECILNTNIHNKIKYINEAYDDELTHKGCKDIYIKEIRFFTEEQHRFGFDIALAKLKRGSRVAREGWNGKNMFVYYVPEGEYVPRTEIAQEHCTNSMNLVPYRAYFAMKTADGTIVPWVASQTDLIALDWYVVQ